MTRVSSPQGKWQRYQVLIITAISLVALDQFSKLWVRSNMTPGSSIPPEGILRLTYITNTGGVFGLFPEHTTALIIASAATIVVLLILHHYLGFNHTPPNVAFGLILGGAVGNLIDRVWRHEVTDFIDIQLWHDFHWPPFNFADSAVVAGVVILIGWLIYASKRGIEPGQHPN